MRIIPEETFLIAANALANIVTNDDLESGNLYPPLKDIQKCSVEIAVKVMKYAYEECMYYQIKLIVVVFLLTNYLIINYSTVLALATFYPEPKDYEAFIKAQLYDTSYSSALPLTYAWPKL